jgi:hypothetical protein
LRELFLIFLAESLDPITKIYSPTKGHFSEATKESWLGSNWTGLVLRNIDGQPVGLEIGLLAKVSLIFSFYSPCIIIDLYMDVLIYNLEYLKHIR